MAGENKTVTEMKEVNIEDNKFSEELFQKQSKLELIKGLVKKAGYGEELASFGDRWFEAVSQFGLIRDKKGNAFFAKEDETPEQAAERLSAENDAFYIPQKDSAAFKKYANDGSDGFKEEPFQTPPKINRPNFILRFLDYCGFDIPAVKEYHKQLESVQHIPYYFRLSNTDAVSAAKKFKEQAKAFKERQQQIKESELKEKEKEKEAEPEKKPEQKQNTEPEKKPEQKQNTEPEKPNVNAEKKPEGPAVNNTAVSIEETENEIKITMADGSVQTVQKSAQFKGNKEKEAEPIKAVPEKTDPEAEGKEAEEKEADKDTIAIDKKIAELQKKEQNYPASSPMGIAVSKAIENLQELKLTGLPEGVDSPEYDKQFSAAQKATASLMLVDNMEHLLKTLPPEKTRELTVGREDSLKITRDLESLTKAEAVANVLTDNTAAKMRRILGDDKALEKLSSRVFDEMQRNPEGNLIPKGAVVYRSIYKEPGKPGWQRMPGASEEAVKSSIEALSRLPENSKFVKRLEVAERLAPEKEPKNSSEQLDRRIEELKQFAEKQTKNSVMKDLTEKAVTSLEHLKKTGMPVDPKSPDFKKQQQALGISVCTLTALERIQNMKDFTEKIDAKSVDALTTKLLNCYADDKTIDSMLKNDSDKLINGIENGSLKNKEMLKAFREESNFRKENSIPESAERKGVLFRMSPKEPWKQMPGASQKEVNDSLLTVLDENRTSATVSTQKSLENVNLSDKTIASYAPV